MKHFIALLILTTALTGVVAGQGKSAKGTPGNAKKKTTPTQPAPKPAPVPANAVWLDKNKWSFELFNFTPSVWGYENGTLTQEGSALSFQFPTSPRSAMRITRGNTGPLYGSLFVTFSIATTGTPQFLRTKESGNTCDSPAMVRLYIEGENWWEPPYDFKRWWSNPQAVQVGAGTVSLVIPIAEDQWSSVFGAFGNANEGARQGFSQAMGNPYSVGLAFGAGCFFGHGVHVSNGTAKFTVTAMSTGF